MFAESRPLFVDNRNGNTLAQALTEHLQALRDQKLRPGKSASPPPTSMFPVLPS